MFTGPDGEYFTDQAETPIPPKNTWDQLTTNQLIDVQNQLQEKLWAFSGKPTITKTLQLAVNQISALISSRGSS